MKIFSKLFELFW